MPLSSVKGVCRALFGVLMQEGQKAHRPLLSLTIRPIEGKQHRFSFVVSKKVLNKAAERNRLKRRGRAIVRGFLGDVSEPYSGIFFFKKGAEKLSFDELQKEITFLLKKAGVV